MFSVDWVCFVYPKGQSSLVVMVFSFNEGAGVIGTVRAAGTRAGSGFSRQAETIAKLRQGFAVASRSGWRGFDPYDGLLSPIARLPVVGRSRSFRLALTQVVKRSPVNLRPVLGIKEGLNHKALALLLSAAARNAEGGELRPYVQPLAA